MQNRPFKLLFIIFWTNLLDTMNFVAPGTSYDKWVKTNGAELTKSWLHYKWFDTVEKLDYSKLPAYWHFYSKLKNEIVLSTEEY